MLLFALPSLFALGVLAGGGDSRYMRGMKKIIMAISILFLASLASCSGCKEDIPAPDNVAAAPADAEVTDSGLASIVLNAGSGSAHPGATSTVKVHYTGWTTDGKMFDSSVQRGKPAEFPLDRVIKGWTEGVQLMVVGEKRRFWIPAELAYGKNPGGGKPGGMLCFEIELLEIK